MRGPYRIRRLGKSDRSSFISVIIAAFAQDPLFLEVFGDAATDPKAKAEALRFVNFMFAKSFLLSEEAWGLFDGYRLLGVYIIEVPEQAVLRKISKAFVLAAPLIRWMIGASLRALLHLNEYMKLTRSQAPAEPHGYLIMIGVAPEAQGNGIGKTLLQHLLGRCEDNPAINAIALDTENERNVRLYEKMGFVLEAQIKLRELPIYCMRYNLPT